jgi:hypothetical protein
MMGSMDAINARISDLVDAALRALILGAVTDDPRPIDLMARPIAPALA